MIIYVLQANNAILKVIISLVDGDIRTKGGEITVTFCETFVTQNGTVERPNMVHWMAFTSFN